MREHAKIVSLVNKKWKELIYPSSPKKNTRSPHFCLGRRETHLHNRYGYNKPDDCILE
jgi:hypothetical protein